MSELVRKESSNATLSAQSLLTIKEASQWASAYLNKQVTESNISYLVQYGRLQKIGVNGSTQISEKELKEYYDSFIGRREVSWKKQLGADLNWALSFDYLREADTTKHVHRLHPYKGKFIPQLVEYFLDTRTDEYKKEIFFKSGDIVLDPFCGSGTTLVQANELGIHAVGIDISEFNALISNTKIASFDLLELKRETDAITRELKQFLTDSHVVEFEQKLLNALASFNESFFPSPDFKRKIACKEIDGDSYGAQKAIEFRPIYDELVSAYQIKLAQPTANNFVDKWYLQSVREEIDFVFDKIKPIENRSIKAIISIILSRTIRSCRATTHADLATLKEPVLSTYYCAKHGKVCKPLFSILGWWRRYCADTISRLSQFEQLRTPTNQLCLAGDARQIDILQEVAKRKFDLAERIRIKQIDGIFSSPPYVGLIDYHEQHAYAYDLFGFKRKDALEIGRLFYGQGKEARLRYIDGIVNVLTNSKKFLRKDYNVFLVANDKYDLYPIIAEKSNMAIVNRFKRPVLNRTERDKAAYSETIFHLREK